MPKGQAIDPDRFFTFEAKTVKKAAEETLAIWTPVKIGKAGEEVEEKKRFRLMGFNVSFSVEATLTLEDEASVFFIVVVAAKTNFKEIIPEKGYLSKAEGNKLNFKTSAEGALTGTFYGIEDRS